MLLSDNGMFAAILGYNGNFAVVNTQQPLLVVWQTNTLIQPPLYWNWVQAQTYGGNGYLVLYNSTEVYAPLWFAVANGTTEGFLMSNSGYIIALDANN